MATIVVMHARPFDPSATRTIGMPEGPDGPSPESSHGDVTLYGDTTDVYAAWGAPGYTTAAADTPASTYIPGLVTQIFGYELQVFGDVDMTQPGAFSGGGQLAISDLAGTFDGWLAYGWDGHDITLRRGESTAAYSTFTVVARLTCDGWAEVSRTRKVLKIRDLGWRLARPIELPRYLGTGGTQGGADLVGKTKPFMVGLVWRAPVTLVDAANLLYHYHTDEWNGGTLSEAVRLYVGGVEWTYSATAASYEELLSLTIPAGYYSVCRIESLIRLGSAVPTGQEIRVDGYGMTRVSGGNGADNVLDYFIETMAAHANAPDYAVTANVSVASASTQIGLSIPTGDSAPAMADVLNALTYGAGWYWWPALDGTIYVRALTDPATASATVTLDASRAPVMVTEATVIPLIPRLSTVMRWKRYAAPEAPAALAGSLDLDTIADYGREWRVTALTNAGTVGVKHKSARDAVYSSAYYSDHATARAIELHNIFSTQRYRVTLRVGELDPFDPPIGEVVALTNFNRLGFGASKNFLCIGAKANAARNSLELTLWG